MPDEDMQCESRIGPRLRVWWMPQIGGETFTVLVNSLAEAWISVNTLAAYDLFEHEQKIKPDYSNAGGVSVWEDGEWQDWEGEECETIDDMTLADCVEYDRDFYNEALRI